MLATYQALAHLALDEFKDVVVGSTLLGGTPSSPNKLRLLLEDASFIDIWLTADGDYSYHWERRRQRGLMYRWDNAPHHPTADSFPAHLHDGDESSISESSLSADPVSAVRQILQFARLHMA
jgi:hypothetical protein